MNKRPMDGAVSTAPALNAAQFATTNGGGEVNATMNTSINLTALPAEIRAAIAAQTTPDFAPVTVTNAAFLAAIAPNLEADERLWSAHFTTKPGGFPPLVSVWGGYPLKAASGVAETPNRNSYFSVATVRPDKKGEHHRRIECFSRLFCVVLDDAAPPAGLVPTWVLATSEGKTQVGYKLATPLADSGIATRLHKVLAAAGHLAADKNGNNPVRYVRLPVGTNTKYNPVFAHKLLHWEPNNTVTLDALIDGLGLDRAAILTPPVEPEKTPINSVISNAEEWVIKAKRIALDAALRTHKDPALGRHQEIFALGCRAARDGLPPESLEVALEVFAANMRPTDTNGVESGINWDSEKKAIRDGYRQGHIDGVPKPIDASGLVAQAPAKATQPAAAAPEGDEPPLTRPEAESLIAWAWSTGTTLPRKPAGLFTYRTLKNLKGEPKTRDAMRSPISGFNTYSAPWIELGWHTTKADFMGEVAKYLPNRANIVMAQAEKNGTVPNDVSPDALIADAQLWLARVSSLVVNDTIGRELLARVPANKAESNTKNDAVGVKYQCANSFTVEPIEWLWKGWLAAGKLHILAGAPGTGKTTVALALAATISVAGRWPDGTGANRGRVMIWSGEDDPCDTIVPRLMANGADLSRVNIITGTIGKNGERGFDPGTDLQALTDTIAKMEEPPALLIVDPIVSAVAGDSHKNAEVRRALQPLVELAMQRRCAVLGISHFSKGTQGRDPVERVTGSLAFGALARIVLAAAKLPDEEGGGRILARGKSNIGKDDGGFKYELVVVNPRPDIETTAVLWAEAVEGSARELLGQAEGQADSEERSATREAEDWLREFLSHGAAKAKDVQREARECGIGEKALRTARERLGIKPTKSGFHGGWLWSLPCEDAQHASEDAKDAQEILFGKTGHLGHLGGDLGILGESVYGDETSFSCSKTQHDSDDTGVF